MTKQSNIPQNKAQKPLAITSTIISSIACALSFAGSVMMFCDYRYDYGSWYYSYSYYRMPENGIMPFFGFLLVLVATILIGIAIKNSKKLAIGSLVLSICGSILLLSSIALAESYIGIIGAIISMTAGGLAVVVFVLSIVITSLKAPKTIDAAADISQDTFSPSGNAGDQPSNASTVYNDDFFDQLKQLKYLLDDGILTQEEFNAEKAKILDK